MFSTENYSVKYLTHPQVDLLLRVVSGNKKYEVLTLLMMDCGLRVSEAISLQFQHFDFKHKVLRVKSLKKRGKALLRDIPISDRLYQKLASYLAKFDSPEGEDYLFPGNSNNSKSGHIHRTAVHKYFARLAKKHPALAGLHPHKLRHTCGATLINNGTAPERIKAILGHQNLNTTLNFYAHLSSEELRKEIDKSFGTKVPWWKRALGNIGIGYNGIRQGTQIIHLEKTHNNLMVGRKKEFAQLAGLVDKNVNVLILGPQGVGKTHLLNHLKLSKKVLRLDEFTAIKKTLAGMLMELLDGDKEHCRKLLYQDRTDIDKILTKESIKNLTDILCQVTERHEYTLIIDDITGITPTGVKVLEYLRQHFHLICSARSIKANKAGFLTNFERVELEPLARPDALTLIESLSYEMDIEDTLLFRNHIYEQCGGNPQYLTEIIERYKKEGTVITDEMVRSIRHGGGRTEIDMSVVVVLVLAGLAMLRYIAGEFEEPAFKFIGGAAMILLIGARYFFFSSRRRFV